MLTTQCAFLLAGLGYYTLLKSLQNQIVKLNYVYTKDCCGQSASAPVDLAIKCLPVIPGRLGANVRESMAAHYTVKEVTLDVFHVKILSVSAQLNIQTSIHPSSLRWECTLHRDSGHLSLKPFPVFSCVSKDAAPS